MDLDEWINEPPSESSSSSSDECTDIFTANNKLDDGYQTSKRQEKELDPEEINKVLNFSDNIYNCNFFNNN